MYASVTVYFDLILERIHAGAKPERITELTLQFSFAVDKRIRLCNVDSNTLASAVINVLKCSVLLTS